MEGHWWGDGDLEWRGIGGVRGTEWRDIGGVREHRMEGHWWGEGDRMEGHWWGEGTQNGRTLVG